MYEQYDYMSYVYDRKPIHFTQLLCLAQQEKPRLYSTIEKLSKNFSYQIFYLSFVDWTHRPDQNFWIFNWDPLGTWFYLAFSSIRSRVFIFGLASGDVLTQTRAISRIASIWLLAASDILLPLKSRTPSFFLELHETHFTNWVPSVTAGFLVSSSSRMTPKL